MAIATSTALIAGGIAAAGAVAGAVGGASDKKSSTRGGITLGAASGAETAASAGMEQDYAKMRGYVDAGPGAEDVTAGYGAQKDLATMLKEFQTSGGMPTGADMSQAETTAGGLFRGQRMALTQNFEDQRQMSAQNAAIAGRGANDPVLRNKLAQEETRQQMLLDANQGSLSQSLAMNMPGQRLGYAGQRASVLQGLASQAMSNRQALLGIGEGIQTNERNFRLKTGETWGEKTEHGSLGGALAGGLAGAASGMKAFAGMGGMTGISSMLGMGGGGASGMVAGLPGAAGGNDAGLDAQIRAIGQGQREYMSDANEIPRRLGSDRGF